VPMVTEKQRLLYDIWTSDSFTKWTMSSLTEYDKVILIDADKIGLRNTDELFDLHPPALVHGLNHTNAEGKEERGRRL